MIFEDRFLFKLYKVIAVIWLVLSFILAVLIGLIEKNFHSFIQVLVLSTYPYALIWLLYYRAKLQEDNRKENEFLYDTPAKILKEYYVERPIIVFWVAVITILYFLLYKALEQ